MNLAERNFPLKNSFASKDFYQEVRFYFIGTADFEKMNEIAPNTITGKKEQMFMNKSLLVGA